MVRVLAAAEGVPAGLLGALVAACLAARASVALFQLGRLVVGALPVRLRRLRCGSGGVHDDVEREFGEHRPLKGGALRLR